MSTFNSENKISGIPASRQQEGVWFHSLKEGSAYWNFIQVRAYTGIMNAELLARALQVIVQRHSSLRTNFVVNNNSLYQVIRERVDVNEIFFHRQFGLQATTGIIEEALEKEKLHAFDFGSEALLRFTLLDFRGSDFYLVLTVSHIVTDAESMHMLWQELVATYNAFSRGMKVQLAPASQYVDYSNEQLQYLLGAEYKHQLTYWQNKISSRLLPYSIPFKPAAAAVGVRSEEVILPAQLVEDARSFTLRNRVLYSSVYQAAYMILLSIYGQAHSVVINNVLSGRGFGKKRYKGAIGLFSNRMLVTCCMNGGMSLKELVHQVNSELLENFENSNVPYEDLTRWFRSANKTALHDVVPAVFNMVPGKLTAEPFDGLTAIEADQFVPGLAGDAQYDIGLSVLVEERRTRLRLDLKCDDTFSAVIPLLADQYLKILNDCVYNSQLTVSEVKAKEGWEISRSMNDTAFTYPDDITIVDLIAGQAIQTPLQTAVQADGRSLSYRGLDEKSNQLANHLAGLGVARESLVAICIERSVEMMVGILGILKAGGAYLPIDPEYPSGRIEYILSDAACSIILTSSASAGVLPGAGGMQIILLDEQWPAIERASKHAPMMSAAPRNLAYVIYTSGSSGRPKGVMNQHDGLLNRILWAQNYFRLTAADNVLQKTTFSFDVSVWELLWPLAVGARVVFARPGLHADPHYLHHIIQNAGITMLHFVPSVMEQFLLSHEKINAASLLKVLCSGEELKPHQVELFKSKMSGATLYNLYGPTECAIDVTVFKVPEGDEKVHVVPIGKPVHNVSIHILDSSMQPLPVGVAGEICVAGIQVARGYLNQPLLTHEKFCEHSLSPTSRMYRTGDLGRRTPGGDILYLGRIDNQVKINGNRIELGEIETCIQESGRARQSVVIARTKNNHSKELVAFVVSAAEFAASDIMSFLQRTLPSYMVPQIWIPLQAMPLNQNGKIDRKALEEYSLQQPAGNSTRPPATKTEAIICSIWQELLQAGEIGSGDNFFALGGDSLLAMRMASVLSRSLLAPVTVKDVFNRPSVAELASYLDTQVKEQVPAIIAQNAMAEEFPLSYSQERLWFIDKLDGTVNYHIPAIYRVKGEIDLDWLARAFAALVTRHEALRTMIRKGRYGNYQHIADANDWELRRIDAEEFVNDNNAIRQLVQDLVDQPFDLEEDYMLRVHAIVLSPQECILVINIHHISFDAWSWNIFASELAALYSGEADLPPVSIQYKDFALWQRKNLAGEFLAKKIAYWKDVLADSTPLDLPMQHAPSMDSLNKGANLCHKLDHTLLRRLKQMSASENATLFMTLVAAFKIVLHHYSAQKDISIGTTVSGRDHHETESVIGLFVNTVVLRSHLNDELPFREFLHQVKRTTIDAYDHREAPFEKVVEHVGAARDTGRPPLFQVMFSFQNNVNASDLRLKGLELQPYPLSEYGCKFDLTVIVTELESSLDISVTFPKDLFTREFVLQMLQQYERVLKTVAASPNLTIFSLWKTQNRVSGTW